MCQSPRPQRLFAVRPVRFAQLDGIFQCIIAIGTARTDERLSYIESMLYVRHTHTLIRPHVSGGGVELDWVGG